MPKILVHKAFNLLLNSTSKLAFEPGLHDVADEVANHWYTKQYADVIGDAAAISVDPNSDGRRVLIDRLVSLFRIHVETLDIEKLAEMLDAAENRLAPAEPTGGEGKHAEIVEPIAPAVDAVAEPVEPPVESGTDDTTAEFDPALVEAMTDDELRAHIKKRDGKPPHHNLKRENLVALALAPAAAEPTGGEG